MPKMTDEQRYAKYRARGVRDGDCLIWPGATTGVYGVVSDGTKTVTLHRFAFRMEHGRFPAEGLEVSHGCPGGGNPLCFEPTHLLEETRQQNLARRVDFSNHWETQKTTCPRGHAYDRVSGGARRCKTCDVESNRKAKAKMRAKRLGI